MEDADDSPPSSEPELLARMGEAEQKRTLDDFAERLNPREFCLLATGLFNRNAVMQLGWLLQPFARKQFAGIMAWIEESEAQLQKVGLFKDALYAVSFAAANDPETAVDFILRKQPAAAGLSAEEADGMKVGLLAAIAGSDPRKAMSLYDRVTITSSRYQSMAGSSIGSRAASAEARGTLLAAVREHLHLIGDEEAAQRFFSGVLKGLGSNLGGVFDEEDADGNRESWGFNAAMEWLGAADLSDEERQAIIAAIGFPGGITEMDRWVEWLIAQESIRETYPRIASFTEWWARNDPEAAGKWLLEKHGTGLRWIAAIGGVAEGTAHHSIGQAEEIAGLLPEGEMRQNLISSFARRFERGEKARAWRREDGGDPAMARFWLPP